MEKHSLKIYAIVILFLATFTYQAKSQDTLHVEQFLSGLTSPVFVCSPPNDPRIFIVEQPGRILIYENDSLLTQPFLDITSQVVYNSERGLLGLVFHPDFATNGYFYVNYTTPVLTTTFTRIDRFTVDAGDPNLADLSSEFNILQIQQPFNNHNGGMMQFGPDGYLYIGLGDGGGFGDPNDIGQNRLTLLGKMLRIDVDSGSPYAIPNDNPFVGDTMTLDEIWALGLRNPWRFAFDYPTGDLYIADVGQDAREEINRQPASSTGGENYGWRLKEGDACYNPSVNCEDGVTLTDPFFDYTHSGVIPPNCSVTGGFVYRGSCIPAFDGLYFFADFCSGRVWSIRNDNGTAVDSTEYEPTINIVQPISFGFDNDGELYITTLQGLIYKITPEGGSSQCNTVECCEGIRGNVENDPADQIDISDLVYFISYSFGNPAGPAPVCFEEADVNGDLSLDISDIVYLVSYMFGIPNGPAPLIC